MRRRSNCWERRNWRWLFFGKPSKKRASLADRLVLAHRWIEAGFRVRAITEILHVAPSTYYAAYPRPFMTTSHLSTKRPRGRPTPGFSMTREGRRIPDELIKERLMELSCDEWTSTSGYKKWGAYLRSELDLVINKKKVYRLCQELGILKEQRRGKPNYPRHVARKRPIHAPNQLWQMDIKYGTIEKSGRFFFICNVIDVYDRTIVGYYRGPQCRWHEIQQMLVKAFLIRGIHRSVDTYEEKLIIRTDNGPQFVSNKCGAFMQRHRIYHERIPPKTPNMNAYVESFHSQLQLECFNNRVFTFFDEAYLEVDEYYEFYNARRPHGSLKYMTPAAFHEASTKGQLVPEEIRV
ncbi:IS3 family transposase [Alkalicoccus chagannorensis]|nr:IS3 family transposase [Alkalicoccus chagannorensis]